MKKTVINFALIFLSVFLFFTKTSFGASSRNLTVFTEPNMVMAITKIARVFSQKNNVIISVNFGSSEDAVNSIDSGEPSDVLISAHHDLIENLRQKGLVDVYNVGYIARDKLVLVTSTSNNEKPTESTTIEGYLRRLNQNNSTLILDYEGTSSGKIARDFLKNLDLRNLNLFKKVAEDKSPVTKPLENETNSYALLLTSQIYQKNYLEVLATKPDSTIFYQALVIAGDNMDVAREFLKFLRSDSAKKIFTESGFFVD